MYNYYLDVKKTKEKQNQDKILEKQKKEKSKRKSNFFIIINNK